MEGAIPPSAKAVGILAQNRMKLRRQTIEMETTCATNDV